MADDLVARLRVFHEYDADKSSFMREAADRIEQLEAALREIAELNINAQAGLASYLARAALERKDG